MTDYRLLPISERCSCVFLAAWDWGRMRYPDASVWRLLAFANSVAELVAGYIAIDAPTPARQYLVLWSLLVMPPSAPVDNPAIASLSTGATHPPLGEWEFEAACEYAAEFVFSPVEKYAPALLLIMLHEDTGNNDPEERAYLDEMMRVNSSNVPLSWGAA